MVKKLAIQPRMMYKGPRMTRQPYCPNRSQLWGSNRWVQRKDLLEPNPQGPDEDCWFSVSLLICRPPGHSLWTCQHRNRDQYRDTQGETPELACQNLLGHPVEVLGHLYYPVDLTWPKGFRNLMGPPQFQYLLQTQDGEWGVEGWPNHLYPTPEQVVMGYRAKWLESMQDQAIRHRIRALGALRTPQEDRAQMSQVARWWPECLAG
jgi:hypothetical protein